MDIETKRREEKDILACMVRVYCRGQRHNASKKELCPDCAGLLDYALARADRCVRMQSKTFCSNCPSPCYSPQMRERIRVVMRYSGVRMLWHCPVRVLRHVFS